MPPAPRTPPQPVAGLLVPTVQFPEQCMCCVQLTFAQVPLHSGNLPFPCVLTHVPPQPETGPSAHLGPIYPPFLLPGKDARGLSVQSTYQVPQKVLDVFPSFIPLTNPP